MRGVEGLEHQRRRVVAGLDTETRGGFSDAGCFMPQRLEQTQHAVRADRGAEQHRANDAFAQFLGKIVEDLVARRLNVFEQLLHQFVVVIGQRLQHGEARFLLAVLVLAGQLNDLGGGVLFVDKGALQREIDEAGDDFVFPNRNLPQKQRHSRGRLQQLERLAHAAIGLVDLVEKQEMRNVLVFEFAQDQLQLRHLFLVGFADHDRRVDRRQHRAHVMNEFDRTGAIDKRVTVAHELSGGEGGLDTHLVLARFLAGVADGGAGIDRALARDRACARENGFEKCGLAALEGAHQRDAPGTLWATAVLTHGNLPDWPGVGPSSGPRKYRFRQSERWQGAQKVPWWTKRNGRPEAAVKPIIKYALSSTNEAQARQHPRPG